MFAQDDPILVAILQGCQILSQAGEPKGAGRAVVEGMRIEEVATGCAVAEAEAGGECMHYSERVEVGEGYTVGAGCP